MKKIVLLAAVAMTSIFVAPTAILLNNTINSSIQEQEGKYYGPDSLTNIFKNFNLRQEFTDHNILDNDKNGIEVFNHFSNGNYQTFFNNKTGNLASLKMIPKDEVILQTFSNTYTNKTSNKQTFPTQEYEKTITNTHSFSVKVSEKASAKTKVKIPFIGESEILVELNSEQSWSNSKTTTEKLTYPKQSIQVNPYSVGKVSYVIKQGTYYNQGVIRVPVDLNDDVIIAPLLVKDDNGNVANTGGEAQLVPLGILWLINNFNENGFGQRIKLDSQEYSFLSTDNPDNPTIAYVNLPITWESQGGNLDVTFEENPLSIN